MYIKRLKDIREDHDMLQKQVASILKITRQQYSLYETGERSIPVDKLCVLAEFYNTSTDYILGLTDNSNPYEKSKINKMNELK